MRVYLCASSRIASDRIAVEIYKHMTDHNNNNNNRTAPKKKSEKVVAVTHFSFALMVLLLLQSISLLFNFVYCILDDGYV